jgi:hypothetical protein
MSKDNRWTKADGDEAARMVLSLVKAVRDEMKRDDVAPVDYRIPNDCSCYAAAVPELREQPGNLSTHGQPVGGRRHDA